MTDAAMHSTAACPACVGLPDGALEKATASVPKASDKPRRMMLSLPDIHCAACIDGVETRLEAMPEVTAARVNLSLKRVTVTVQDDTVSDDDIAEALENAGFRARPLDAATLGREGDDAEGRALAARMGLAGFATMNVMMFSIAVWAGADGATRDLLHWVSAAIALPVIVFAGMPFYRSAWSALRGWRINMDVPITLAIVLAAGLSVMETAESGHHAYFDAAVTLTFFLLIGRYLDHRTRSAARSAATELAALDVLSATRITKEGTRETVPADALRPGDTLFVAPGAHIPADGTVLEGRSDIDRALLTGESLPAAVTTGDEVHAGMLNLTGPLTLRAERLGEDTLLRDIGRLVEAAETGKTRYSMLADKAVALYAPGVHILSALSFIGWWLATGDLRTALNVAAAVLIITCPCALGLAVPSVQAAASGLLYRMGVLVKDGTALERLAQVDHVVFDKTGTLTTDLPLFAEGPNPQSEAFAVAHALARASNHPLSQAIVTEAEAQNAPIAVVTDITEHPGEGLSGAYNGQTVRLGSGPFTGAQTDGHFVKLGEEPPLPFAFTHKLRPGAAEMVMRLKADGLPVTLLSGDTPDQTARIAAELGIEDWRAEATPASKLALIEEMDRTGTKVLMVGDGINDTAALAAAHVSMSPGTAAQASRAVADMVILGEDIGLIGRTLRVSRISRKRILENFQLASAYNIIAVPVAMAGLCSPLIAALAMSASSLTVTLNALRLTQEPK
ncbi:MAG: heavy metal translocating P-type ATPase [Pseudomonadota bacterium]